MSMPLSQSPTDPVQTAQRLSTDLTGLVFGKLTVLARHPENSRKSEKVWVCRCECGAMRNVPRSYLLRGQVKNCEACAVRKTRRRSGPPNRTSKNADHIRYGMVQRCHNPRNPAYPQYGGRGITVCDRWRFGEGGMSGRECFAADMGARPPGFSIDRIDNNKGYEPGNCRWTNQKGQIRNSSITKLTEVDVAAIKGLLVAGHKPMAISRQYGVSNGAIYHIAYGDNWKDVQATSAKED